MEFATKYGPWALVVGASDGVGAAFAEQLARRDVNVVLLARRQNVLDEVAAHITAHTDVETRTLAIDLAAPGASAKIIHATKDVQIGMLVYCAGADPNYEPFLSSPVEAAEALVQRNCLVLLRLCHHFAPVMVQRGRGGIAIFSSGAAFAGGPNMVAYGATKAFDMLFAEGLWVELHDKGIDVLGLILGKTDTPALRRLEYSRGQIASEDEVPPGAVPVDDVVTEAFDNLANGPTLIVGEHMRFAAKMLGSVTRNEAVQLVIQASAAAMGSGEKEAATLQD